MSIFRPIPEICKLSRRNDAHKNCQGHHYLMPSRLSSNVPRSVLPRSSHHRHALHGRASPRNSASANPPRVLHAAHADVKVISSRMRPLTGREIRTRYKYTFTCPSIQCVRSTALSLEMVNFSGELRAILLTQTF